MRSGGRLAGGSWLRSSPSRRGGYLRMPAGCGRRRRHRRNWIRSRRGSTHWCGLTPGESRSVRAGENSRPTIDNLPNGDRRETTCDTVTSGTWQKGAVRLDLVRPAGALSLRPPNVSRETPDAGGAHRGKRQGMSGAPVKWRGCADEMKESVSRETVRRLVTCRRRP